MLDGLALNMQLWTSGFQRWLDYLLGANGVLRGPLIAFVAISLVSAAIYYVLSAQGILFGSHTPKVRRDNRVAFEGAGTVWASDQELNAMIKDVGYEKVEGRATSTDYVATDEEGNELSKIKVTRWSSD